MRSPRYTAELFFLVSLSTAGLAQQEGMVSIPGGEFQRGRTHALPDDGIKWFPVLLRDDRPVKAIRVDEFLLDVHEVTNREYAEFVQSGDTKAPYYWPQGKPPVGKENEPVANVSWQSAVAYCESLGKRLPTEAEWEKACRGGAEGAKYPWSEEEPKDDRAHYDSLTGPKKVCAYEKNAYGLCDMAGNVWEWTSDWYEKDFYQHSPSNNPKGPHEGIYRVLRGGSWADEKKYLTCAYRSYARPAERSPNIGFRCTKDID